MPTQPHRSMDNQAAQDELTDLMSRYQRADSQAADELVRLLTPVLSRYYHALSGNSQPVDDLVQECWLRLHRARQSYRPGEPVLPWVFAIARHARIDHYRRWQRSSGRESSIDQLPHQASSDPRQPLEDKLRAGEVLGLLDGLPEGQREVLLMLKVTGMSTEEVARATESTVAAVKQKAYRAYQAVRQALAARKLREGESDEVRRR